MRLDIPMRAAPQPTVLELFRQWAACEPDRTAIVQADRVIGRAKLSSDVAELAAGLRAHGLTAGDVVAVELPRGPAAIAALLAVWEAGAVFLGLDPSLPALRRDVLRAEAGARWLVRAAGGPLPYAPSDGLSVAEVDLDTRRLVRTTPAAVSDLHRATPAGADAAYLVFTSGTTGRPKGILGRHAGLSHFVTFQSRLFEVGPDDRVLQTASLTVDGALKEIGLALVSGASLIFAPHDDDLRSDPFGHRTVGRVPTIVQMMPSLLANWLAMPGPSSLGELRVVALAGEPLSGRLVRRLRDCYPNFTGSVFNFYGQTETTVSKTFYRVPDDPPEGVLPLGRPLPDTEVYVLNDDLRPCGPLEVGQIAVRTPYRTAGYVNSPDAQAAAFVPNPACDDPDDLLYLSGDLGRFDRAGNLVYVGRLDDEIKINGVRIHPGEPEAVLAEQPEIRAARVLAVEQDGVYTMLAFCQPRDEATAGPGLEARCRRFLEERLPTALIPAAVVAVPRWPLTGSGKADRSALLEIWRHRQLRRPIVPPRDEMERAVAAVWGDVLGRPAAGVTDNFFESGGHSLMIVRLVALLRERLGVDLPVRTVWTHPTVAELATAVRTAGQSTPRPAFTQVDRSRPVPLTDAQKRLWLVQELLPSNAAYNMPTLVRLRGPLLAAPLQDAFDRLRQRHEVLRLRFQEQDGEPAQVVDDNLHVPVEFHDLTTLPAAQRDGAARRLIEADALVPFNLHRGACVRLWLLRLDEANHLLYLNAHHVLADGWSVGLLLNDLFALWRGEIGPPPEVDFLESVAAQPAPDEADLDFWRERLRGPLPVVELPSDGVRPPMPTLNGAVLPVAYPASLGDAVRALAARCQSTPFVVLLAAFVALVHRLTGQDDLLIGSDHFGREDPRFDRTAGMFVRTLAYRIDASGPVTFAELVRRTHETVLQSQDHARVDFSRVVQAVSPDRDLSRTPLFQVMFRMFTGLMDLDSAPWPGVSARLEAVQHATSKFDVTLTLRDGGGISGELEYSTDLFGEPRMRELINQYRRLVEAATAEPGRSVLDYPLCEAPPPAVPRSDHDWLDIGRRVQRTADRRPDAVAVSCGRDQLTYRMLIERSGAVAATLLARGVRPGDVVALAGDKSVGFVVGMLGVLRSGAVVLPLEASLPPDRQRLMAEVAATRLLIAVDGPEPAALAVPCFHLSRGDGLCRSEYVLPDTFPEIGPSDLATLFFTSGTTGRPKGILGNHGALADFLLWEARQFSLSEHDRVAQITSLSFDAVLRDLWAPLVVGGSVRLPTPRTLDDVEKTLDYLGHEHISVIHTTPSVLEAWLHAGGEGRGPLSDLRLLALAGEPLSGSLVTRARRALLPPNAQVVNFYGPSETMMIKAFDIVSDPPEPGVQPIGRPIEHAELVLLNQRDVVCSVGELGDIHIGHRYAHQAYLTSDAEAGAFRPDPRPGTGVRLLYRTGDLGRWRPDGRATIAGRRDDELKIRGQRVNPAEVAAVLKEQPEVDQAAVLPHDQSCGGEKRLVAFYSTRHGRPLVAEDLFIGLQARLPAAMIPADFVHLPELPVLANGKVDRRRLLELSVTRAQAAVAVPAEPPATVTEQRLHDIWAQYLKRPRIGTDENFFRIGGHSLLATIVLGRTRAAFTLEIPLRAMFQHPTIRSLARHIDESLRSRVENLSEEELIKLLDEGRL